MEWDPKDVGEEGAGMICIRDWNGGCRGSDDLA